MKNNSLDWGLGFAFFFGGLLFFTIGFIVTFYNVFNEIEYKQTLGIVIDIEEDSNGDGVYPIVEISVEGKKYKKIINKSYTNISINDAITVSYNPNNPSGNDTKDDADWPLGIFFMILPIPHLIIGGTALYKCFKYKYDYNQILKRNHIVYANIDSIQTDRFYTHNGVNPFFIKCSYKNIKFESNDIFGPVEKVLEVNNIKTIPVYVNPEDMANEYVVDISSIKKMVKQLKD